MPAIVEATLCHQRLDILEAAVLQAFLASKLEFSHAWRIDQTATLRQCDQCAMGGGVATARIVRTHGGGSNVLRTQQGVGQGGLARAR
jgi:hypothetical protein